VSWNYSISGKAIKQLKKLDKQAAKQISISWMNASQALKTPANGANNSKAS